MKRIVEALVPVTAAVLMLAAAPGARAVAPVVTLKGSASLTAVHGSSVGPAIFHVDTSFATDTPGAQPFTIQKAVIFFPDHSGTNGRLFASCSAKQIERFRGAIGRCPKGSKIGSGSVKARALQLGITASGRVTMFNSRHGKSIAINIQTTHPAYINETIEAPITQLHGKYGEKLTLVVPHSLQEIIPGLFVAVQDFNVVITGAVRVHGVAYSYLKARTCPKQAMHGEFGFKDWTTGQLATATADAKVRCTAG